MSNEISPEILKRIESAQIALVPSRKEVLRKHGHLIAAWQKEREPFRRTTLSDALFELWKGVSIRVAEGMREFQAGLADLTAARVLTTRDAGPKSAARPSHERVFIQKAKDCYGRVGIQKATGQRVNLEFSLRDPQGKPLNHFCLTVSRCDGKALLNRHEVRGQSYVVENVELASYEFLLESPDGQRRVRMGWELAKN